MKVSLLDLDMGKRRKPFPNLALMKLSSWHKKQGDDISLNFPLNGADIVYASCVFTWNKPKESSPMIKYGGSGINNYDIVLLPEIEHIMPDYSLYNTDFSIGYTSRGCIRGCPFCKVVAKEGGIKAWAHPSEFYDPHFPLLILLDNNIFAAENCLDTFEWLIKKQIKTDIKQGMDIRLLDDKKANLLKQARMEKYRFAFDNIAYEKSVRQGIELMITMGISPRKLSFYVLIGFSQDDEAIERVKILQSYSVDIYPMIYKDDSGKEPDVAYNFDETLGFHGARQNLRKFLRLTGRI